jgi:hypothetical protein
LGGKYTIRQTWLWPFFRENISDFLKIIAIITRKHKKRGKRELEAG